MDDVGAPPGRRISRLALAAFALAVVALVALAASGPLTRAGAWDFRTGFTVMKWAAWTGIAASLLSLAAALFSVGWRSRGLGLALAGMAIALGVVALPWSLQRKARTVPPIHDVTTDTTDPPLFEAVLPLRADAPNPAEPGGSEVVEQQRQAYPDVEPLLLDVPSAEAFDRALRAAHDLGWDVVAANPARGRIEATDTTFWFGFEDDVVVRVRPEGAGSRVDLRSVSRVGKSDVGANAARIRRFVRRIARESGGPKLP